MSVCFHDPNCPGHGPAHEAGLLAQYEAAQFAYTLRHPETIRSVKDRRLPGKKRRQARKAARR